MDQDVAPTRRSRNQRWQFGEQDRSRQDPSGADSPPELRNAARQTSGDQNSQAKPYVEHRMESDEMPPHGPDTAVPAGLCAQRITHRRCHNDETVQDRPTDSSVRPRRSRLRLLADQRMRTSQYGIPPVSLSQTAIQAHTARSQTQTGPSALQPGTKVGHRTPASHAEARPSAPRWRLAARSPPSPGRRSTCIDVAPALGSLRAERPWPASTRPGGVSR